MFSLYADKNNLTLKAREMLTSGSVNVYQAQFEFSADWDGLTRTAVFQAGSVSRSVLLDESGTCTVPWEVLKTPGISLAAGVYGEKDGEVVLPTIWARLGLIMEGAAPGEDDQPPTPDLWEQELAKKQDKLHGQSDQLVGFDNQGNAVPVDAGEAMQGPPGPQGPDGPPGRPGKNGADGATFTPTVSEEGVISWSNDGGLPNPKPVDIKGAPGSKGEPGTSGKDATINGHNAIILAPGENVTIETAEDGTVTISAASGQHIYSTEEQVVGRWIDGKPVYMRTIIIDSFVTGTADADKALPIKKSDYSIDTYINSFGSVHSVGNHDNFFPINSSYASFCCNLPDAPFLFRQKFGSAAQTVGIDLTIFYTKTTDQATIELLTVLTAAPAHAFYKAAPQSAAAVTLDAGGGETVKNKQIDDLHNEKEV